MVIKLKERNESYITLPYWSWPKTNLEVLKIKIAINRFIKELGVYVNYIGLRQHTDGIQIYIHIIGLFRKRNLGWRSRILKRVLWKKFKFKSRKNRKFKSKYSKKLNSKNQLNYFKKSKKSNSKNVLKNNNKINIKSSFYYNDTVWKLVKLNYNKLIETEKIIILKQKELEKRNKVKLIVNDFKEEEKKLLDNKKILLKSIIKQLKLIKLKQNYYNNIIKIHKKRYNKKYLKFNYLFNRDIVNLILRIKLLKLDLRLNKLNELQKYQSDYNIWIKKNLININKDSKNLLYCNVSYQKKLKFKIKQNILKKLVYLNKKNFKNQKVLNIKINQIKIKKKILNRKKLLNIKKLIIYKWYLILLLIHNNKIDNDKINKILQIKKLEINKQNYKLIFLENILNILQTEIINKEIKLLKFYKRSSNKKLNIYNKHNNLHKKNYEKKIKIYNKNYKLKFKENWIFSRLGLIILDISKLESVSIKIQRSYISRRRLSPVIKQKFKFKRKRFFFKETLQISWLIIYGKVSSDVILNFLINYIKTNRQRIGFVYFFKSVLIWSYSNMRNPKFNGIYIRIKGILRKKSRRRKIVIKTGIISIQTHTPKLEYSRSSVRTIQGLIGIQVWLSRIRNQKSYIWSHTSKSPESIKPKFRFSDNKSKSFKKFNKKFRKFNKPKFSKII